MARKKPSHMPKKRRSERKMDRIGESSTIFLRRATNAAVGKYGKQPSFSATKFAPTVGRPLFLSLSLPRYLDRESIGAFLEQNSEV